MRGYHLHQVFIVAIDEDGTVVSDEEVIEFTLGLADTLEGAETLQVGTSHVGDETTSGFGRLYQCLDVARMRGTHLYDSYLCLVVQSKERLGHTHVVVEVTLRCHHAIALCQDGTNQFLRGSLAISARDAHHRHLKLATMLTRQVLEGLEAVVDLYEMRGER